MIDPSDPPAQDQFWRPPLGQVAIVSLLCVGVLFLTVGASAQFFNLSWGLWFSEVVVFLGVPFVALQVTGRAPLRSTGLDQPAKGLAAGFVLGALNYAAWAVPLMWVAERFFPAELVERYSAARLFDRQSGLELSILVAGISLAAPFCEEFFYRGLLQRGLAERLPIARAIVVTALLFSLMHFDPVGFLARFELGLLFGLLAWRGGSLWPAIGAHAANNITSLVIFFAAGGDDGDLSIPLVGTMFVAGNLALVGWAFGLSRWSWWVAPQPAADDVAPFAPFFKAVAPWMVGALVGLVTLAFIDRRGVQLNIIDVMTPVPAPKKDASEGERAAWKDLQDLRARVRSGDGGLDEYKAMRQLAAPQAD